MARTTTRRSSRFNMARLGASGACVCAPHLQQVIDALQQQLLASQARVVQLTTETKQLRSLMKRRRAHADSAIGYIEGIETLTPREREVLLKFIERPCDKEVASRLGTRTQTVRNQMRSIQAKFGVSSRAELIAVIYCRE